MAIAVNTSAKNKVKNVGKSTKKAEKRNRVMEEQISQEEYDVPKKLLDGIYLSDTPSSELGFVGVLIKVSSRGEEVEPMVDLLNRSAVSNMLSQGVKKLMDSEVEIPTPTEASGASRGFEVIFHDKSS